MITFYEELIGRGLDARRLTLELAWSVKYLYELDQIVGIDNVTYKEVQINKN